MIELTDTQMASFERRLFLDDFQVCVTGTRHYGLITPTQVSRLAGLIQWLDRHFVVDAWNHGECTGVDALFHLLVEELVESPTIVIHPADVAEKWRAQNLRNPLTPNHRITVEDRKPPKVRNGIMVHRSDLTIVVPKTTMPQRTGGTWNTYDVAMKSRSAVQVIWSVPSLHKINYYRGEVDIYRESKWIHAIRP